jgi:hypothetical protein
LAHLPDLAALVIEPGQVSWTPVST